MHNFFFFVLRLLGRLPLRARRFVGARLGDVARWILRGRRRVAARNLSLAFPEFSPAKRRSVLRRHFRLLGAVFLDECALCAMPENKIREWIQLPSEDELQTEAAVFCAPHFVAAGIGGLRLSQVLGRRVMFHYRPLHNKFWDKFYRALRERFGALGIAAANKNAMHLCARNLQRGGMVFYLPDTDVGRRKSAVFAPFLGVQSAATTTAVPRLAAAGKARVRMFVSFLTESGYALHLSPPLPDFPGDNAAEDARRMNDFIGEQIRRDPAQYYWLHRRFKTRPDGEAPRYA